MGQVLRAGRAMAKARREGKLGEDFDVLLDDLLGTEPQQRFEAQAAREAAEMAASVDPDNVPFSLAPGVLSERIERAATAEPLQVNDVDSWQGISASERGKKAKQIAEAFKAEVLILNADRKKEISVSIHGLKHWARYAADPRKAALLGHLRPLFERAIYLRSESPDARFENDDRNRIKAIHKLALPVRFDDEETVARLTVKEDANGRWIYDGRVLEIETPADGPKGGSRQASETEAGQRDIQQARVKVLTEAMKVNEDLTDVDRFSLAPRSLASVADTVLAAQMRKPEFREKYLELARQRLAKLRQDGEWQVSKWGQASQRVGTDTLAGRIRTPSNIEAERKFRQRSRQRELIDEGMAKLTPEMLAAYEQGLTTIEDDPLVKEMLSRGKLMSKSAAEKAGKLKTDGKGNAGDYDGAPWLPPKWFARSGGYMPDRMAQELYDAGLLREPTPDAFWEALGRAIGSARAQNEAVREIEKNAAEHSRAEVPRSKKAAIAKL